MATVFVSFRPGSLDASRKPAVSMTLVDGKRRWMLYAPAEFNVSRWELLGAGIPEFRRRITAECGAARFFYCAKASKRIGMRGSRGLRLAMFPVSP